jgi:hypothetical protein
MFIDIRTVIALILRYGESCRWLLCLHPCQSTGERRHRGTGLAGGKGPCQLCPAHASPSRNKPQDNRDHTHFHLWRPLSILSYLLFLLYPAQLSVAVSKLTSLPAIHILHATVSLHLSLSAQLVSSHQPPRRRHIRRSPSLWIVFTKSPAPLHFQ